VRSAGSAVGATFATVPVRGAPPSASTSTVTAWPGASELTRVSGTPNTTLSSDRSTTEKAGRLGATSSPGSTALRETTPSMGLRSVASTTVLWLSARWSSRARYWASAASSADCAAVKAVSARSSSACERSAFWNSLRARLTSRCAWASAVRPDCTCAPALATPAAAALSWRRRSPRSRVASASPAFTASPSCSGRDPPPATGTWATVATRPGTRNARSSCARGSRVPE